MRVAVVDDEEGARGALVAMVRDYLREGGSAVADVEAFVDGRSFLAAHAPGRYGLILLDCMLGEGQDGLSAARSVRASGDAAPVVLVTSSPDFAVDGYEVGAVGYLVKPVTRERLTSTLLRVGVAPERPAAVVLGEGASAREVDARRISFCQARGHYVEVHDVAGPVLRLRAGFSQVQAALSGLPQFYCSARGWLVNFDHVRSLEGCDLVMNDGSRVPVRQRGVASARRSYSDYLFKMIRGDGKESA